MPSKGEVCINNISTNDVWFEKKSAVFQDYQRYKVTLKENINVSDMENSLDDNRTRRILDSMIIAGLNTTDTTFPKGLDTMLATEYVGIDLSGGQWQRIAIARGIYKAHSFIVLDKPTSSIDPINENILLNTFFVSICTFRKQVKYQK